MRGHGGWRTRVCICAHFFEAAKALARQAKSRGWNRGSSVRIQFWCYNVSVMRWLNKFSCPLPSPQSRPSANKSSSCGSGWQSAAETRGSSCSSSLSRRLASRSSRKHRPLCCGLEWRQWRQLRGETGSAARQRWGGKQRGKHGHQRVRGAGGMTKGEG